MRLCGRYRLLPKHFSSVELSTTSTPSIFNIFFFQERTNVSISSAYSRKSVAQHGMYFTKTVQPWLMDDTDIPVGILKSKSKGDRSTNRCDDEENPSSVMSCACVRGMSGMWWMQSPEEQMRGSVQVIRVVNYPESLGEEHSPAQRLQSTSVCIYMHTTPNHFSPLTQCLNSPQS